MEWLNYKISYNYYDKEELDECYSSTICCSCYYHTVKEYSPLGVDFVIYFMISGELTNEKFVLAMYGISIILLIFSKRISNE
jgi:hypothetical protein